MGYYKVKIGKNGKHHFNLHAGNHQVVLSSQMYADKKGCEGGIASCQKNGGAEKNFEVKKSTNGKHYFNLKSGNGQVIGKSEMYETPASCKKGMASVMKNSPAKDVKMEEK